MKNNFFGFLYFFGNFVAALPVGDFIKGLIFCRMELYSNNNSIIMITQYIQSQIKKAKYKILEDGVYFGEISGLKGVWASGKTLEICRQELQEVLEEWILLKLTDGDPIPGLTPAIKTKRIMAKQYA